MKRIIALFLTLAMAFSLAACGAQPQVQPQETTQSITIPDEITRPPLVTNVDDLLSAIKPGAYIELAAGEYRLDKASDYGKTGGEYYTWIELGLGEYELQIQNIDDLTIVGSGSGKTNLITEPRFANVLSLKNCTNVNLEEMTLGHTVMTQVCEGGVLRIHESEKVNLVGLGLYGCGTLGVLAWQSSDLAMTGCEVYDCSLGGLQLSNSRNITVTGSSFHSLGKEKPINNVFLVSDCENVVISECSISDNYTEYLLWTAGLTDVTLRSNHFTNNRIASAAFWLAEPGVVLEDNVFESTDPRRWYSSDSAHAVDKDGNEVIFQEESAEAAPVTPGVAEPVSTGEQKEVRVYTVDDFLNAIDSDTCIILEGALLDFSQSQEYRAADAEFSRYIDSYSAPNYYPQGVASHYWVNNHDGPSLIISGVTNMTIKAEGTDRKAHTLSAKPRYADVLTFENCSAITLEGFTAGHTIEPGYCTGGVFLFRNSEDILVNNCGMYGCGTEGFHGEMSTDIQIVNSEIYECSYSGIELSECENVAISGTIVRDIGNEWGWDAPNFLFRGSKNVTFNGESMDGNYAGD